MKKKKKYHLKKKYTILLIFILILVISFSTINLFKKDNSILNSNKNNEEELNRQKEEEAKSKRAKAINDCISSSYNANFLTPKLENKIAEITKYIQDNKYQASVKYEDMQTGFNYEYQASKVYYGCSLIKIVDALYLINKAINNEIDLDQEKVLYASKYVAAYSSEMAKRKVGEYVSLRDLITYAISVSDNTAHLMLIDYIGFNNLKKYGNSLGATSILTGGDKFGNQTAYDTNIYLKKAYEIITQNEEYGSFLKSIMDNDERNDFNTDEIRMYHKYGSYDVYYHDIGLDLDNENPYALSILTLHEKSNHKEVIQNIHTKIRELHELYYEEKKTTCEAMIDNNIDYSIVTS